MSRLESASTDASPPAGGWRLEHTYTTLPGIFYSDVAPTSVRAPRLIMLNRGLAESIGLDPDLLADGHGAAILGGNQLPPGSRPIAQAYAGHQFGYFTTLGDGRAILLGEQITPRGDRVDVQLKGPGTTPYSRRGDGRAALGPMLREYLISEAMHALGIPTTRSLAVVATGEDVFRQDGPQPGAVLTRVAGSHLRVGTFQWAAAQGDEAALRALVDYTVQRHYPELASAENAPLALLQAVIERQASLIARWMQVGFIHGVMNTDNMALSGETIDYGPCAFMDAYDPNTVFSSIDEHGRYAYGNQPAIAGWNLARFAESLLPVIDPDQTRAVALATEAVETFAPRFLDHWQRGLRRKLGLFDEESTDRALSEELLRWMHQTGADFTNTFAELSVDLPPPDDRCVPPAEFRTWHEKWRARVLRQPQAVAESDQLRQSSNPAVIPRNHLVEAALAAATQGDLGPFRRLLNALAAPYDHERAAPEYRAVDPQHSAGYRTFCGT